MKKPNKHKTTKETKMTKYVQTQALDVELDRTMDRLKQGLQKTINLILNQHLFFLQRNKMASLPQSSYSDITSKKKGAHKKKRILPGLDNITQKG